MGLGVGILVLVVGIVCRVAVIDDVLAGMDEVARGLPCSQCKCFGVTGNDRSTCGFSSCGKIFVDIIVLLIGAGLIAIFHVIWRKQHILLVGIVHWHEVLVLGIDEATAHDVFLHVDEVQLHHAGDVAVVLMVFGTFLGGQLQEHARSQCHLVVAATDVADAELVVFITFFLIAVVSLAFHRFVGTVSIDITELHVAGQVAHVVHQAVDAEVVAVQVVVAIVVKPFHIQRHFAHAVDGVFDVLAHVGHAVLGTLQHHAAAEDTAEVGTLDGVQQSSGIDGAEAVGREGVLHGVAVFLHQLQIVLLLEDVASLVGFVEGDVLLTDIL